jgi:hypothetical protein
MQKYTIPVKVAINDCIEIIPISDIHILSTTFDKSLLKQIVDYVKTRNNVFWVGVGDYGEFIKPYDKRFDPLTTYPDLKVKDLADIVNVELTALKKELLSILTPEKCLGLAEGNHDLKLTKDGSGHIVKNLCDEFKLRYLGYSGYLKFTFSRTKTAQRNFIMYYHHGWVSSRSVGTLVNSVKTLALTHDCHIAVSGHSHAKVSTGPIDVSSYNGPIQKQGIVCGAFKRGVDFEKHTWEESKGYDMQKHQMGTWIIQVKPFPSKNEKLTFRILDFDPMWL